MERSGGRVEMQRCWRIITTARGTNTGLAVSRSLGDLDFKEPSMCGSAVSTAVLLALQHACVRLQHLASLTILCFIISLDTGISGMDSEHACLLDHD